MAYSNPDRQRRYVRYWIKLRRTQWFAAHGPCKQCGSSEKLELDHIDPSRKRNHNIWSWSDKRRTEELAKCQVLCRLCHRAKTNAQLRASPPPRDKYGQFIEKDAPGGSRTPNPQIRSLVLYPIELQAQRPTTTHTTGVAE